jgi:hypothetical protein
MEFDIGMSYKLLDNLSYSIQAGYLVAGDMIDDIAKYHSAQLTDLLGEDVNVSTNDIWMLTHSLTMTF